MGNLTLADDLLLLASSEIGTFRLGSPALEYGLAGALLIELALAERVTIQDGRVAVTSARPVGEPRLDAALARVAGDRPRKQKDWVPNLTRGLRAQPLDGLVAAGILRRQVDVILWVFRKTRHPAVRGGDPAAEIRARLTAAVNGTGTVEPRTAALCALVRAVKLEGHVFPGLNKIRVKARLKEISDGEWAAAGVRTAIEVMEAAVMVDIMVPAVVAASSG
jgi:hypothetical protein